MRPAVFLDRDGTLNHLVTRPDGRKTAPWALDEFVWIEGAAQACRDLRAAGHFLVVVTNKPDIARGQMPESLEHVIAQHMGDLGTIDSYGYDSGDDDDCIMRKPNPGMFYYAAVQHGIDLQESIMIGDTMNDVLAAERAGLRPWNIFMVDQANRLQDIVKKILLRGAIYE